MTNVIFYCRCEGAVTKLQIGDSAKGEGKRGRRGVRATGRKGDGEMGEKFKKKS